MSKSVRTDHEFNIKRYSELLVQAQGNRTQTEFAKDCGLSTAYICKHVNRRIDKAPIPSTLRKIAAVAANGVTYEELLDAAGYDVSKHAISDIVARNKKNRFQGLEFEKIAIATITSALSKCNLKWSLIGKPHNANLYDLDIELQNEKIKHWYFKFITSYTNGEDDTQNTSLKRLFEYYGRISILPAGTTNKYSFVTDSQEVYTMLKENSPLSIAMYVSIILIDTCDLSILREEYVKSAFSDNSITNLSF